MEKTKPVHNHLYQQSKEPESEPAMLSLFTTTIYSKCAIRTERGGANSTHPRIAGPV